LREEPAVARNEYMEMVRRDAHWAAETYWAKHPGASMAPRLLAVLAVDAAMNLGVPKTDEMVPPILDLSGIAHVSAAYPITFCRLRQTFRDALLHEAERTAPTTGRERPFLGLDLKE
jgi:hypothetical protein